MLLEGCCRGRRCGHHAYPLWGRAMKRIENTQVSALRGVVRAGLAQWQAPDVLSEEGVLGDPEGRPAAALARAAAEPGLLPRRRADRAATSRCIGFHLRRRVRRRSPPPCQAHRGPELRITMRKHRRRDDRGAHATQPAERRPLCWARRSGTSTGREARTGICIGCLPGIAYCANNIPTPSAGSAPSTTTAEGVAASAHIPLIQSRESSWRLAGP